MKHNFIKKLIRGTFLVVQCLRLRAPKAGGLGSNSGQKTKIPQAASHSQNKKKTKTNPELVRILV